jgi:arsenate reductase
LNKRLKKIFDLIDFESISQDRKDILLKPILFIQERKEKSKVANLIFICTHNSRRSQFAQLWATFAADYYGIETKTYSGGTEITAFNKRAIASLERFGFDIQVEGSTNPKYQISWGTNKNVILFSKLFDDKENPQSDFAAIMTCDHADKNCPIIPGAIRIPLMYEDPKRFDDSPLEGTMYDYRSFQIATEMMYIFSKIN